MTQLKEGLNSGQGPESKSPTPVSLNLTINQKPPADAPPPYSPSQATTSDLSLSLHPVPSQDALVVKVQPPRAPAADLHHVPGDIVLVIDVSGSMGTPAPVPGTQPGESSGLTVLDLVKHTALAIVETLGEEDRLGIVTFSSDVEVKQLLKPMSPRNKEEAKNNIKEMVIKGATNLWGGITEGLKLFDQMSSSSRVPAMLVLTDGIPNHMCPPQGYVPKLRTLMPLPASIHTFGFGYQLRSGLLRSIAEIGAGNYAFIPDAGMVGTVFVHATANLQTTYATEAVLELSYAAPLELEQAMGASVDQEKPQPVDGGEKGRTRLRIPLGNLQYGQSRDLFLRVKGLPEGGSREKSEKNDGPQLTASVRFRAVQAGAGRSSCPIPAFRRADDASIHTVYSACSMLDQPSLSAAEIAYHDSRARICSYISNLDVAGPDGEHRFRQKALSRGDMGTLTQADKDDLDELIASIPARSYPEDPQNQSLIDDLEGMEPYGQVSLALKNDEFCAKWGTHYVRSYLTAHTRQICNSFKDPGPLQYGVDSPLFIACRDRLNEAFDNIPPPKPSGRPSRGASMPSSMRSYNNRNTPCFAASATVRLASGREVAVRGLRRGVKVQTPAGPRKVAAVLKTPVKSAAVCRVGDLLVTPWHPVSVDGGQTWSFPADVSTRSIRYTGAVYSILLQRDADTNAHAVSVSGVWGVTLGHGITSGSDVRAHAFFGDYGLVGKSLARVGAGRNGVVVGGGLARDARTGRVCGFRGAKMAKRI